MGGRSRLCGRPFASLNALVEAMNAAVRGAGAEPQIALDQADIRIWPAKRRVKAP